MKYKILALIGESGAGKDTIMQEVIHSGLHLAEIVSCTTRPPREGEIDGKNYHFLSNSAFLHKLKQGEMLETSKFNNWFYGTSLKELNPNMINIGVFNPDGILSMLQNPEVELAVIHVRASDKTRLIRQLSREENPNIEEILRRYQADKKDFSAIQFDRYYVNNETEEDKINAVKYVKNLIRFWNRTGQKP